MAMFVAVTFDICQQAIVDENNQQRCIKPFAIFCMETLVSCEGYIASEKKIACCPSETAELDVASAELGCG